MADDCDDGDDDSVVYSGNEGAGVMSVAEDMADRKRSMDEEESRIVADLEKGREDFEALKSLQ